MKCLQLFGDFLTEESPIMLINGKRCFAFGPNKCTILHLQAGVSDAAKSDLHSDRSNWAEDSAGCLPGRRLLSSWSTSDLLACKYGLDLHAGAHKAMLAATCLPYLKRREGGTTVQPSSPV